jgi:hypothetical protein
MHGGTSCLATQSAYTDVGDGAVVEPDEANAVADGDDAAVAAGLRTHAKVRRLDDRTHRKRMRKRRREERTVMSATAQATNATETLPPTMDITPEPCVRPNGRDAAAMATTEGARLHASRATGRFSGAAHVDETHIAELDAHIIPAYLQWVHHVKVQHRCAGRRLTRAAQHKVQPRREGIKPGVAAAVAERHRAGRQ